MCVVEAGGQRRQAGEGWLAFIPVDHPTPNTRPVKYSSQKRRRLFFHKIFAERSRAGMSVRAEEKEEGRMAFVWARPVKATSDPVVAAKCC